MTFDSVKCKSLSSGRKSDTVSRELNIPAVTIDKWWLARQDITHQYEKFCAANREDSDLLRSAQKYQENLSGADHNNEEELHDLKDLDFTPEEVSGKVEVESDDEVEGKRRKKRKVDTSPYKRRKRVELPTVKSEKPPGLRENTGKQTTDHKEKRKLRHTPAKRPPIKPKDLKMESPPPRNIISSTGMKTEQPVKEPEEKISENSSEKINVKFGNVPVKKDDNEKSSETKKETQKISTASDSSVATLSSISSEHKILPKQSQTLSNNGPESLSISENLSQNSTLDLDEDDSEPIVNFLETVKESPAVTSPVVAPKQSGLSSVRSVKEVSEELFHPLATSSKYDLTGEFSKAGLDPVKAAATQQISSKNIKKEFQSSLEYIEDILGISTETEGLSDNSSVVERYYSRIDSQPSSVVTSVKNIKAEKVEEASSGPSMSSQKAVRDLEVNTTTERGVRERSVSPPASEFPLVPVEGQGLNLDLFQPAHYPPPPPQRGARVRVPTPTRGRTNIVRRVPRGRAVLRSQPPRGFPVALPRGQVVRGRPFPHQRGRGQLGGPIAGGQVVIRGARGGHMAVGRGQLVSGRGRVAVRGRGYPGQNSGMSVQMTRGPGRGMTRPRPPVSAPLPEKLSNIRGLSVSVTREKPVSLPRGVRLPSGITLSHPRGIQNQPPAAQPSAAQPRPAQPLPPAEKEKKERVSLEVTARQLEALRTLGYL